jgi:hypothetical protein
MIVSFRERITPHSRMVPATAGRLGHRERPKRAGLRSGVRVNEPMLSPHSSWWPPRRRRPGGSVEKKKPPTVEQSRAVRLRLRRM